MLPGFHPEARLPAHARRVARLAARPVPGEPLMSLPRGVGSAGRLGEPLSRFPASGSSELAFLTGYFGEGAAARDVSMINLCKKELKYSP